MFQVEKKATSIITTVSNGAATGNDPINYAGYGSGVMILPSALTSIACKWDVSNDGGSTWTPLADGAGNDVSTTVAASKAVPLPAQLAGAITFRPHFGTNEGAARTIIFQLKS